MSLQDTGKAIGAVSDLLRLQLSLLANVKVGRPPEGASSSDVCLYLFLYEILYDATLKNVNLPGGGRQPLWLVLKYILTVYDGSNSDNEIAHEYLGKGMQRLQNLNFLRPAAGPLAESPEPLKITFDEVSPDLISKIMQGPDEKYRCSIGFQVRPVMIVTGEMEPPALLVGIDYSLDPSRPRIEKERGVVIPALPGVEIPEIREIIPLKWQPPPLGTPVSLRPRLILKGERLDLGGLSLKIADLAIDPVMQKSKRLECIPDDKIASGKTISAGVHPLHLVLKKGSRFKRVGNTLLIPVRPRLETAVVAALDTSNPAQVLGQIRMTGLLLGTDRDDILVCLLQEGIATYCLEGDGVPLPEPLPSGAVQTQLVFTMKAEHRIVAGRYQLLLIVNGEQAENCPEIRLTNP